VISFGDRILPRGLFCAIVVALSNKHGWQLKTDNESIHRRNLIEFSVQVAESDSATQYYTLGSAVIFNKITHIEVLTTCQSDDCFLISSTLKLALDEACDVLKYDQSNFDIEKGFNCNCKTCPNTVHHTVVLRNTKNEWVQKCSKNRTKHGIVLKEEHLMWFHSSKGKLKVAQL